MTGTRPLFAVVIFLAAFLLFLVEPIAAKQLVPILGGSAAVWITCLVFFQTALLCAYAYAHWIARGVRWILHLLLLAVAVGFAQVWAFRSIDLSNGPQHPVATIFFALTLWIGLPFIALGASSPLLQYWWSRVEAGPIPYRLFALSNLASLLALAAYPVWIEPRFTLHDQRVAWFWGFVGFAVLAAGLTLRSRSSIQTAPLPAVADLESAPASSAAQKWLWFLLPMGASMQLAAITSFITANIAAIPLLWILPLAVYLLTIIFAFEFPRLLPPLLVARFFAVMLASVIYMVSQVDVTLPLRIGTANDPALAAARERLTRRMPAPERDELAEAIAVGTPDDVIALLRRHIAAGMSKFVAIPIAEDAGELMAQTEMLVRHVLPAIEDRIEH